MKSYICPHCEEKLTYVRYETLVREIGTFDGEDYEKDDEITIDDIIFLCPLCFDQLKEDEKELVELLKIKK
uniref:Uncharacterized protein n=1 Tax=viral metagenome TaxID=1070528 RepID=A0A6H2A3F2_9ZZZZ